MKVAPTKIITLISSSVNASAKDEYVAGTTYVTDNEVKVSFESDGTTPRFPVVEYESIDDGNVGNYPPDSPTQWSETGTSNIHAMFDGYINSATIDSTDIDVVVGSAKSDFVGLFGLSGSAVTLTLSRNGSTIKTEEISLKTLPSISYYVWLFEEYDYKDRIFWEYPKYSDASLLLAYPLGKGPQNVVIWL